MSLARALTKRYRGHSDLETRESTIPSRAYSTKRSGGIIDRAQISLPVELLSSTNALAYEAPDLNVNTNFSATSPSTASSANSYDDSDSSPGLSSSSSLSSPDISREPSPSVVEPNHLSTYFRNTMSSDGKKSRGMSVSSKLSDVPVVPRRAPSHTRESHRLSERQRSLSHTSNNSRSSRNKSIVSVASPISLASPSSFSSPAEPNHPFGPELAQVNELVEVIAATAVAVWDEEEQYLAEHGLKKFGVDDYLMEIKGLYNNAFGDGSINMGWI